MTMEMTIETEVWSLDWLHFSPDALVTAAVFRHCQRQSGLGRTSQVASESQDFPLPPEIFIKRIQFIVLDLKSSSNFHHCHQKWWLKPIFHQFLWRTPACAGRDTTAPCTGPTAARDLRIRCKIPCQGRMGMTPRSLWGWNGICMCYIYIYIDKYI